VECCCRRPVVGLRRTARRRGTGRDGRRRAGHRIDRWDLGGRDGLVVLGVERTGPDFCMPYSLALRDGRMKASFKARQTSAMIHLQRMPEPAPAAAQASTRP